MSQFSSFHRSRRGDGRYPHDHGNSYHRSKPKSFHRRDDRDPPPRRSTPHRRWDVPSSSGGRGGIDRPPSKSNSTHPPRASDDRKYDPFAASTSSPASFPPPSTSSTSSPASFPPPSTSSTRSHPNSPYWRQAGPGVASSTTTAKPGGGGGGGLNPLVNSATSHAPRPDDPVFSSRGAYADHGPSSGSTQHDGDHSSSPSKARASPMFLSDPTCGTPRSKLENRYSPLEPSTRASSALEPSVGAMKRELSSSARSADFPSGTRRGDTIPLRSSVSIMAPEKHRKRDADVPSSRSSTTTRAPPPPSAAPAQSLVRSLPSSSLMAPLRGSSDGGASGRVPTAPGGGGGVAARSSHTGDHRAVDGSVAAATAIDEIVASTLPPKEELLGKIEGLDKDIGSLEADIRRLNKEQEVEEAKLLEEQASSPTQRELSNGTTTPTAATSLKQQGDDVLGLSAHEDHVKRITAENRRVSGMARSKYAKLLLLDGEQDDDDDDDDDDGDDEGSCSPHTSSTADHTGQRTGGGGKALREWESFQRNLDVHANIVGSVTQAIMRRKRRLHASRTRHARDYKMLLDEAAWLSRAGRRPGKKRKRKKKPSSKQRPQDGAASLSSSLPPGGAGTPPSRPRQRFSIRRTRRRPSDVVASEEEMKQVLSALLDQEAEMDPMLRWGHYKADPPQMMRGPDWSLPEFIDDNGLVVDALAEDRRRKARNPWCQEEKDVFMKLYLKYPRDFAYIADHLPGKTEADCVIYYYHNKMALNLKHELWAHQMKSAGMQKVVLDHVPRELASLGITSGDCWLAPDSARSRSSTKRSAQKKKAAAPSIMDDMRGESGPKAGAQDSGANNSNNKRRRKNTDGAGTGKNKRRSTSKKERKSSAAQHATPRTGSSVQPKRSRKSDGLKRGEASRDPSVNGKGQVEGGSPRKIKKANKKKKKKKVKAGHSGAGNITGGGGTNKRSRHAKSRLAHKRPLPPPLYVEELMSAWTEHETFKLVEALSLVTKDFKAVAEYVGTKNQFQCKDYYFSYRARIEEMLPKRSRLILAPAQQASEDPPSNKKKSRGDKSVEHQEDIKEREKGMESEKEEKNEDASTSAEREKNEHEKDGEDGVEDGKEDAEVERKDDAAEVEDGKERERDEKNDEKMGDAEDEKKDDAAKVEEEKKDDEDEDEEEKKDDAEDEKKDGAAEVEEEKKDGEDEDEEEKKDGEDEDEEEKKDDAEDEKKDDAAEVEDEKKDDIDDEEKVVEALNDHLEDSEVKPVGQDNNVNDEMALDTGDNDGKPDTHKPTGMKGGPEEAQSAEEKKSKHEV